MLHETLKETTREAELRRKKEREMRGGFMDRGGISQCLRRAKWPTTDWRTENTNKEPFLWCEWMGSLEDTWLDFIWSWLWPEPVHISVLWRDSTAKTAANRVVRTLSPHLDWWRKQEEREEKSGWKTNTKRQKKESECKRGQRHNLSGTRRHSRVKDLQRVPMSAEICSNAVPHFHWQHSHTGTHTYKSIHHR